MVCGTFSLSKIPDGQQDNVEADFKANRPPPTSTTKTRNEDGAWTVTATWPPCQEGHVASHAPV